MTTGCGLGTAGTRHTVSIGSKLSGGIMKLRLDSDCYPFWIKMNFKETLKDNKWLGWLFLKCIFDILIYLFVVGWFTCKNLLNL